MSGKNSAEEARKLSIVCAREVYAIRGDDIAIFDLRGLTDIADFFVIACGETRRQLRGMADAIKAAAKETGETLLSAEGLDVGNWILLDFGDCVVHLFQKDIRSFYDLDLLWGDAPRVDWESAE